MSGTGGDPAATDGEPAAAPAPEGQSPEGQSDEDLAAAWGAETSDPAIEPGQSARVLNQAEIDSLLGFDSGPSGDEARTGMA